MLPFSFLMTWRYIVGTKEERSISTMVKICFISITIGTFALALIASIMNGFEVVTHQKMQSIHPQIIMQTRRNYLNFNQIESLLKKEFNEIESFAPTDTQNLILTKDDDEDITNVVAIKGVDPLKEPSVTEFENKITKTAFTTQKKLNSLLGEKKIIIGEKLAEILNVLPGDTATLLVPKKISGRTKKITFDKTEVLITGLFKTGIEEFDSNLILTSINYLQDLFPDSGVTQIGIKLKSKINEQEVINKLRKRFKLEVYSWKELYPALVSALKLEKYVMFFILALVTLVASMNIISLLFMLIMQKHSDIAILKTLGVSNTQIRFIFLNIGMLITITASLTGLIFSYLIGILIDKYPFIELPDIYYVTYLPIKMSSEIFVVTFLVVSCMGFLASLLATTKIKNLDIARILKFEA